MKKEFLLRFDLKVFEKLTIIARKLDRSIAWVIRKAITDYCNKSH